MEWNAELELGIQLFQTQSTHPTFLPHICRESGYSDPSGEEEHPPPNFL